MQRIQEGKFIMKKAISVLMIAACMLCMVTACEKKDKKGNDTSAAQETETDCTAAELVTTEPQGEITISEMIDQRIKEEGKIMIYRMHFGPSKTPLEITEDSNVNIISYDGKELIDYGNSSNRRGETRLGDIIHNKVDYSTYNIGAYGGNWKRHRYVSGGDEKYVEEEGYVQREITTDDSGNNAKLETLYSYSKGTLYSRDAGKQQIKTNSAKIIAGYYDVIQNLRVELNQTVPFSFSYSEFKYPPIITATIVNSGTSEVAYDSQVVIKSITESRMDGVVKFNRAGENVSVTVNIIAIGVPPSSDII